MPAKSFSAFVAADEAALASSFAHNATGFDFGVDSEPTYTNPSKVSDVFLASIAEIETRWNLDRSESARRVYIDLFLHEALVGATFSSIITVEENIADNGLMLGSGFVDYIVSSIEQGTGALVYQPSLTIEAKKGMDTVAKRNGYQWQLLAEMSSAKAMSTVKRGYYYGVLSDGRYWCFYSVASVSDRASNVQVLRSPLYDTKANDGQKSLKVVLGTLRRWLELYNNASGALPLFGKAN